MLAEAVPEVFIKAVERDVMSSQPKLARLFNDEGDTFVSCCMHAGLLWALEALAWSSEHLAEASELLARLHTLDTGSRWTNRPLRSL